MSKLREETISLVKMMPDDDLVLFNKMAKRIIKSWDPDFVKMTKSEKESMDKAIREIESGMYCTDSDINWD